MKLLLMTCSCCKLAAPQNEICLLLQTLAPQQKVMLQKAQNLILKKKRVEAKLRKELEEEAKATDVCNRQNDKNAQKERAETEKKEAEKKKAATEKKQKLHQRRRRKSHLLK